MPRFQDELIAEYEHKKSMLQAEWEKFDDSYDDLINNEYNRDVRISLVAISMANTFKEAACDQSSASFRLEGYVGEDPTVLRSAFDDSIKWHSLGPAEDEFKEGFDYWVNVMKESRARSLSARNFF